jgi:IS30 family transposase
LKKYKQLTLEQRYQIYALKKEGLGQGAIARNLEVNKSTISREIKRNTGLKGYNIMPPNFHTKFRPVLFFFKL